MHVAEDRQVSKVVVDRIGEEPLSFIVLKKYEYCVTTKTPQGSPARKGYTGVVQLPQDSDNLHVLYFIGVCVNRSSPTVVRDVSVPGEKLPKERVVLPRPPSGALLGLTVM